MTGGVPTVACNSITARLFIALSPRIRLQLSGGAAPKSGGEWLTRGDEPTTTRLADDDEKSRRIRLPRRRLPAAGKQ